MDNSSSILPILFVVLLIAGVIAFVVLVGLHLKKRAAERTRAMQQAAGMLGWTFTADAPLSTIPGLEQHYLFSQGHSKKLFNMMSGTVNEARAAIFDYRYTVGHGKHSTIHNQSVVYFQSERLSLPSFSLRPEGFGHKLIAALGYQDIDFANRPVFSKKYLLRGPDEQAIRNTFQDALLAYYENNPKISTDGGGNEIFFYIHHHQIEPASISGFLDWGLNLLNLYRRQW